MYIYIYIYIYVCTLIKFSKASFAINLQSPFGSESTDEICYIRIHICIHIYKWIKFSIHRVHLVASRLLRCELHIYPLNIYMYIHIYIYIHIYKWMKFSKVRAHLVASGLMRFATYASPQREHERTKLSRFSFILDLLSLLSQSGASRLFRTIMGWLRWVGLIKLQVSFAK